MHFYSEILNKEINITKNFIRKKYLKYLNDPKI